MDFEDKHSGEDFSVRVGQDEIGAILDLKETAAAGLDVRSKHRVPSWDQVYEQVSRHGAVLQTLLAPALTPEDYYRELFTAAVRAGFKDEPFLLGLLWHAPLGDAQKRPQRWDYLVALVEEGLADGDDLSQEGREAGESELLTPLQDTGLLALRNLSLDQGGSSLTELFSFLEQRVIMDRKSYESLISELEEVSSRAADLERQVADWERRFDARPTQSAEPKLRFIGDKTAETAHYSRAWNAALGRKERSQPAAGAQSAIQEFLKDNPDLADRHKVQMLQFCLKNYIDINPENSGLPLREKLEMAAKLARDFLGERAKTSV